MYFAAGQQDYEQATLERNRLQAVRALLERQRVADEAPAPTTRSRSRSTATEANAQVFQVRDGVLSDRQSFYLDNEGEHDVARACRGVHAPVLRERAVDPVADRRPGRARPRAPSSTCSARCWPSGAAAPVEIRAAERGGKRRILELAERNARLALDQEKLQAPSAAASSASRRSTGSSRRSGSTRCRCASSASTSRTSAAPTRSRRWSCSRAARRRSPITGASRSATVEARRRLRRRWRRCSVARYAQWEQAGRALALRRRPRRVVRRAAEPGRDRRRQGPARRPGSSRCTGFRERGVAVVSLAKRIEEVFLPGAPRAARARPRHARAAAAPARARRGAPLRDHPPPHPPRQGDDRVDHGRAAGHRPGAQARAAQALRLARGGARAPRARSSRRCPGCRRRSRATSTPTSTRPVDER